jgi:hypothetical protein
LCGFSVPSIVFLLNVLPHTVQRWTYVGPSLRAGAARRTRAAGGALHAVLSSLIFGHPPAAVAGDTGPR